MHSNSPFRIITGLQSLMLNILSCRYPSVCVKRSDPVIYPRSNGPEILQSFFDDLHSRLTNICGLKYHFSNQAQYPKPQLQEAGGMVIFSIWVLVLCKKFSCYSSEVINCRELDLMINFCLWFTKWNLSQHLKNSAESSKYYSEMIDDLCRPL